jgi:F-type H+-transporting ATPase subunit beta
MNEQYSEPSNHKGSVVAVRGSVIDVRFPGQIPGLFSLLMAGDEGEIAIEVVTHLDSHTVRGIALKPNNKVRLIDTYFHRRS